MFVLIYVWLPLCVFIQLVLFFLTSETQALAHPVPHIIKTSSPALIHIYFIPLCEVERHAIYQYFVIR